MPYDKQISDEIFLRIFANNRVLLKKKDKHSGVEQTITLSQEELAEVNGHMARHYNGKKP